MIFINCDKKNYIYSLIFSSFFLFSAFHSYAIVKYGAKLTESNWRLAVSTPIECQLMHEVPNFGLATFTSFASKKMNLNFILDMYLPMRSSENVTLFSVPAPWERGKPATLIEQLRFFKQFAGNVNGQTAWNMLNELEKGHFLTFQYQSHAKREEVSISLSAVAFKNAYDEFRHCVSRLLPYALKDIAFTSLQYGENGELLNKEAKQRLVQISEYIMHSKNIDLILLSSYTDSRGSQKNNFEIATKRADELVEYFSSLGIAKEQIQTQVYGETRPIAVNDTVKGRNQNRRVMITLREN